MTGGAAVAAGSNRLPALAAEIRAAHSAVRLNAEAMAARALAAGRALIEAKQSLGHGMWAAWVAEHVGMSARTARRYMQLVTAGLETATVADLGIRAAAKAVTKKTALAAWPLPKAGEALEVASTRHQPGELVAYVWPAATGDGYHTMVFDAELPGGGARGGGSVTTSKRSWPSALIPVALGISGFDCAAVRVSRFPYSAPGILDELAMAPEAGDPLGGEAEAAA